MLNIIYGSVSEMGFMERYGMLIKVKEEKIEEYKDLHESVWDDVLTKIKESNITNYSIFLKGDTLFSYFEYIAENFEEDMARMAQDPTTKEWWKLTDPCQEPVGSKEKGEWWTQMEEVFHFEG